MWNQSFQDLLLHQGSLMIQSLAKNLIVVQEVALAIKRAL